MNTTTFQNWSEKTPKIRENILRMIHAAGNGHPGGSLSLVEIIMTLMGDGGAMKLDKENYESNDRDRLVLSKGHGCPALYAIMSEVGFDITEDELMSLRQLGSRIQGHPDRARMPFVEASTGSLGQGVSIAQGMAMAYKLDKNPNHIYTIVGDGEIQEGQIWEAALSAPHHKLNNLTLVIDYNKGQIDGPTNEVLNLENLKDKWVAFGWKTFEIDGHNYRELYDALTHRCDQPVCVVAHTIKGKGVDFMEGGIDWHGKAPSDDQLKQAIDQMKPGLGL